MEKQTINKRKRVFSLQPNKNPKAIFVRRYATHLVPALTEINTNKTSSQINHSSFEQTVKHEVNMALALSAKEFAWSHFLQRKLLSSSREDNSFSSKTIETSSYTNDREEEGIEIMKRLKALQNLLPGGEEMDMEEMLSEIGSYIVCLELQMIVLNPLFKITFLEYIVL